MRAIRNTLVTPPIKWSEVNEERAIGDEPSPSERVAEHTGRVEYQPYRLVYDVLDPFFIDNLEHICRQLGQPTFEYGEGRSERLIVKTAIESGVRAHVFALVGSEGNAVREQHEADAFFKAVYYLSAGITSENVRLILTEYTQRLIELVDVALEAAAWMRWRTP